ncbi:MAG TPA: cysteine hydrolase family protein [Burkholderiales bacterium]|nr:cysteine hydrolase family protein [Burkholderiales bacterium]
MTTAPILIDLQNDYFPGGAMELAGADDAVAQARSLLNAFRERAWPIFHIQHHAEESGATFFVPGTPGADIHRTVLPSPAEPVITKHFPSAFRDTPLLERLRALGASKLVVAGMMTHMCVDTTVRAAADLGFDCQLAHDACATRALEFLGTRVGAEQVQLAYLAALADGFAAVQDARSVLTNLTRDV